MKIRDEILAKQLAIQLMADQKKLDIQVEADSRIAELQAVLDLGEGWLLRDTDIFQAKLNRIVSLLRQ